MRILSICYEDMGGYIGGVRQVIEISRHLQRLGHTLELVAPGIRKYKEKLPFKVHYLPVLRKKIFQRISFHLFFPFYLIKRCLAFKPEVVFTYEIFLSCTPMLVAKLFSRPYVMFVNGDTEDFKLQKMPAAVLYLIEIIRNINFKFSSRIFTVTDNLKKTLIDKYHLPTDRISVVNNGVDADYFKPIEKTVACGAIGLDSNFFYIGFLGGMWPWHGLDLLIKSAPRVLQTLPDVKFILAGHGPERENLLNLIKRLDLENSFVIRKEIDFGQAPVYVNSFDICILFFKPIRKNQGNPIKLFEYLACGKSVIASDIDNYGFLLKEHSVGIAINSENPEEVAEAIIRLAQDEGLRRQMGQRAREVAVSQFTWQKTAQSIECDLKECLYGR